MGCYDCVILRCERCPLCWIKIPTDPRPVLQLIPAAEHMVDIPPVEAEEEDVGSLNDTVPVPPRSLPEEVDIFIEMKD